MPHVEGTNRIGLEELTSRRDLGQQVILVYRVIFQIQILLGPSSDEKALTAGAAGMSSGQGRQPQSDVSTEAACRLLLDLQRPV